METIKNYLENIFSGLPKTQEILKVKSEIFVNMEDKYNELKSNGKTENEAIGIVISEFGNIEELLYEMNISIAKDENLSPIVELEEAQEYISINKRSSHFIGLGVALILTGVSILVTLATLMEQASIFSSFPQNAKDVFPVIVLFLFLVPAISLFIFFGTKLDRYKYIEEGNFVLSKSCEAYLTKDFEGVSKTTLPSVIIGVSLCVLSPTAIFFAYLFGDSYSAYGVSIMLLIITLAVYIFIRFGSGQDAYKRLLKKEDYAEAVKEKNQVPRAISGIIWPIAVCIFLISGLVFDLWHICWIVFPITGILFGGFSACYSILKNNR